MNKETERALQFLRDHREAFEQQQPHMPFAVRAGVFLGRYAPYATPELDKVDAVALQRAYEETR